jgi:hypothetical protein
MMPATTQRYQDTRGTFLERAGCRAELPGDCRGKQLQSAPRERWEQLNTVLIEMSINGISIRAKREVPFPPGQGGAGLTGTGTHAFLHPPGARTRG